MMKDYKVGFKKPPEHTRYKKGQSGNPQGRTKRTRNLKTDLIRIMGQTISVREGDRKYRVSKQEGMLMSLMAKCLKGDTKAISTLVNLAVRVLGLEGPLPETGQPLTPQERQLLAEFEARLSNLAPTANPEDDPENPGSAA
jgi:hypothetical protein